MFNSSKVSDSPRYLKTNLFNPNDETANESNRTLLYPKITSTPLNSIFATPPKNQIMTSRRYSLSEVATPPRTSRREYIRANLTQYPPGPLLSSTSFSFNVSTFEDAKSPGLVNRIVQYNEETERQKKQKRPPTHQAKYGTVGLFPVVHLFKNKLPLLEQKPRHVTVRVASPDYIKHTPEYNKKLLEGLVKPNGGSQGFSHSSHSENSTSARSVLDALKEISRKRIHANEGLELCEDTGKRLRTENEDCTDSNKRGRDESPLLDTSMSPIKPATKKICIHEYAASLSSMDFVIKKPDDMQPKRKSISISTLTENPKEAKQVKLINAETQTREEEPKKIDDKSSEEEANKKDSEKDKSKKTTILKVFDDAPLERIRKNRLAALLGTLVGKDPVLEPKPDYVTLLQGQTDESESQQPVDKSDKSLVSILSPPHKPASKTDKHVTFDIPESISQSSASSTSSVTQISVHSNIDEKEIESSIPPCSVLSEIDTISAANPSLSFGTPKPAPVYSIPTTTTTVPTLFTPKSLTTDPSRCIPSFNFGGNKSIPTANVSNAAPIVTSSPPKVGGFKFDLVKPTSIGTPTSTTSSSKSPNFSFTPQTSTTSGSPFAITTSVAIFSSPIVSTFASPNTKVEVSTGGALFSNTTSSTSPYMTSTSQPFAISSVASTKPSFSYGPPAATSPAFAFVKSPSVTTSSGFNPIIFGITSSNAVDLSTVTTSARTSFSTVTSVANKGLITSPSVMSSFGTTSIVPVFNGGSFGNNTGFQSPVKPDSGTSFNIPTTSTSSSFGVSTANTVTGNSSTSGGFGGTSGFGATTIAPSFGSSVTPGFGMTTTPGFGTATTPDFGSTATPSFGTTTPGFGTTATPGFGTTTTPGFGTTTTPGFGTTTTPGFGTTTTPGFGTSTTPGFGTTTTPGFGTTTTPGFGTTTTPGFGTTTTGFGTTTTPGFGTNTTSGFGTNTTPGFGNTTAFGTTTNSGFGTSATSGFGTTTAPSFGNTTNSGFGTPTTTSTGFGSVDFAAPATLGSLNSGFGVPTASVGGFGSSTTNPTGFGTSTTSAYSFGSNTTSASTGFGPSTTTASGFGAAPGTGFGPGTGSIFANSNIPSFGGTGTPSFGTSSSGSSFSETPFGIPATSAPAFGTVTTSTSSFNFGGNKKIFGGTNTSFGASSTTTSSMFASTQSPFGSGAAGTSATAHPFAFTGKTTSSAFPSTNTTTQSFGSSFGQANTGFGAPSSGFGTPNKASTFGNTSAFGGVASTSTQGFGTTQQQTQPFGNTNSVFNKPQPPAQNAFGSSQFNFNQPQNSAPNQGQVFTFGPGPAENPGVFNFGGAQAVEAPKKFDFTGNNTAPPSFGGSFAGTTPVPTFGAANAAAAGGFSIGAGPTVSGRPRKQVTAKRRT